VSAHGGQEYERLEVDGVLVMQLHHLDVEHHHGTFGDRLHPLGNGLWLRDPDDYLVVLASV